MPEVTSSLSFGPITRHPEKACRTHPSPGLCTDGRPLARNAPLIGTSEEARVRPVIIWQWFKMSPPGRMSTVDCEVTVEFAWDFWTNVKNWILDPDVEAVEIDGPFAPGHVDPQTARVLGAWNGALWKFELAGD